VDITRAQPCYAFPMPRPALSYALVTPVRDEAENLPRLSGAIEAQTLLPAAWVVVDDGSSDRTPVYARALAERLPWASFVELPSAHTVARGAPIVRSFMRGLEEVPDAAVVVKLDADVSMAPDYFERLLRAFEADPRLGMASGSAYELVRGRWEQRFGTRTSVWGAARAYRRECLVDVLPLEARMGWDSVDEHKAQLRGWRTMTLLDLPFRHHRAEAERDPSSYTAWRTQGDVCHYLGYRPSYVLLRAAFRALRNPAAVGLLTGYVGAAMRRQPPCSDVAVRARVREGQRLRTLPARVREARGRASAAGRLTDAQRVVVPAELQSDRGEGEQDPEHERDLDE
jgi:poly-beta-1,6-N-acetyl-D-glucosamine synthase